ncbi:D-alanyl-D-alanine carboxypeptidase [Hymenobacter cellulosivorans]|uniref:D-alanyl-D-alanine carboxypeptidase n=1 Tax=Hymenobacter cellulosivorans TaxID=2932249 RepID=A0ABY4F765_9BACT|nr:D-alanyl-D-alanine carboxypeptidase [Hymenobacter cellulosivorans]UOQ52220.1 D-alanyl-D-alanine carboxypeptidase [Hymenobacter cellulosivorans]
MLLLRPVYFLLLLVWSSAQPLACAQSSKPAAPDTLKPGAASLPWLDSLLTAAPAFRQHQVGLSITDATTGEAVYGLNEARYFTPASVMKLFTFYTGMRLLGDSLPSLRYFSRHDTLFFQGTGDPTFLHGDVPSRRAYTFLVRRPERLLAYCDIATPPPYGPSWAWDDFNYYFQPERTAFPLYGNTVRFYASAPLRASAGKQAPTPPQRVRVLPRPFAPLTSLAEADDLLGHNPDQHVSRAQLDNRFTYFPAPKKWVDEVPYHTSRTLLLRLLGDTLRRAVVHTAWQPRPGLDSIRTLPGLPVDSLYRRMLRVSDNFLAEQLLLMCATKLGPPRDSLSAWRVLRHARRNYLQTLPDKLPWVDGSGLSRLNLVTPRSLSALLVLLHQEVPEPRLLSLLAGGGGQGTLHRRYKDAQGTWFWGKTGTLTHTCNLAGYVRTRSGRLLAVSFLNNGIPGDDQATRNEMQRILGQVRQRL